MNLTPANLATLKVHIAANTNIVNGSAINALPNDSDSNAAIANWYNGLASGGDSQAFASPLLVWRPIVTIQLMNSAIAWSGQPAGATDAERTNSWLKWQSMTWANQVDMTDTQVRQGIDDVWGAGTATANGIKATGVGRQAATRTDMLFAGAGAGGARVTPFFGQMMDANDVLNARNLP